MRRAASVLRERVIGRLRAGDSRPGEPFLTDAALVRHTGLSRSTVRRALDELARDGWITREVGRGTFVGPRVRDADAGQAPARSVEAEKVVRLAVTTFYEQDAGWDWYTQRVLAGIEERAEEHHVRVEILGARDGDPAGVARRLRRAPPDVLAVLTSDLYHMMVLRDAEQLGVGRLLVGGHFKRMPDPVVCEDNEQGTALAVGALREAGHERQLLLLQRWPGEWVLERQTHFESLLGDAGLAAFVGPTSLQYHAPGWDARLDAVGDEVMRHVERHRPTGLIAGSFMVTEVVGHLCRAGRLRVPGDVSLVAFDQHPSNAAWLGRPVTTVALPLLGYGHHVAAGARALASGDPLPAVRRLPFELLAGRTVRDVRPGDAGGIPSPATPLLEEKP